MLTIEPTGAVLGATVRGLDLDQPFDESDMGRILVALGRHGVLRFPDQHLDLASLKRSYITGTELVIDGGITGGAITRTGPLAVRPD